MSHQVRGNQIFAMRKTSGNCGIVVGGRTFKFESSEVVRDWAVSVEHAARIAFRPLFQLTKSRRQE